jgi:hypothetical protein
MALSFKRAYFPQDAILLLVALRVGYGGRGNRHGRVTSVLRPALHREHEGSSWSGLVPCRRPGMLAFLWQLIARWNLLFLPISRTEAKPRARSQGEPIANRTYGVRCRALMPPPG